MPMTLPNPAAEHGLKARATPKPELLAPAGDWDALRAAVVNGADAVYFGLSNFNARHRAANFTLEELPEVMKYLHGHNVRGYVAFNTLIFSDELEEAARFVRAIAEARVDAVIVQDLGIAKLIGRMCPALHVHGSTQMTLTEPLGIELVRRLGVRRVILARELSLADIRRIRGATDLPIEVFVHGALCVAYSGQCLTSESLGGRSANRGQCAQACRLPYEMILDGEGRDLGEKAYLLSPQDLAAYDLIGDLADAGVCSLKIEGRLKGGPYVAATTQTYRAAIDAHATAKQFVLPREKEMELAQTFSRGFTHGFLDGVNHQELVHARFPKSRGLRMGTVAGITPRGVVVEIPRRNHSTSPHGFTYGSDLRVGDGVVFDEGHPDQKEQGGRIASVENVRAADSKASSARITPLSRYSGGGLGRGFPAIGKKPKQPPPQPSPRVPGEGDARAAGEASRFLHITFDRGSVDLDAISIGAIVWKTDDPAVRQKLEASYARDQVARRISIHADVTAHVGQPLSITIHDQDGHSIRVTWDQPLAEAQKHPLTVDSFREQFGRLGDSPFELAAVRGLETPSRAMVPKSVLNDLRRQAVQQLIALRDDGAPIVADPNALEHLRHKISSDFNSSFPRIDHANLHVLVRSLDQLRATLAWRSPADDRPPATVYCDFEDVRKCKQAVAEAKSAGIAVGLATVRIIKPAEHGLLRQLLDCQPDLMLIRNLAALAFFKAQAPHLPLAADYSLNIANEVTAGIFAEQGARRMVPSYDLSWSQLSALLGRFPAAAFEAVIHQHMPMFHMEHCVFAHVLSNGADYRTCGRPCESHQVDLRDRAGAAHPLIPDVGCRNTVFNAAAQSAAEFVPRMKDLGIRHFRIELLRESTEQTAEVLNHYAKVIAGQEDGRATWRRLRVLNQLGVTRGTLGE
jgi:U32 family peptidase